MSLECVQGTVGGDSKDGAAGAPAKQGNGESGSSKNCESNFMRDRVPDRQPVCDGSTLQFSKSLVYLPT
jgi:hypothetical protein